MLLYLMRHGVAQDRANPDSPPDPDRQLTRKGVERTRAAARGLRVIGVDPGAILSSPHLRALATAQLVAAELGGIGRRRRFGPDDGPVGLLDVRNQLFGERLAVGPIVFRVGERVMPGAATGIEDDVDHLDAGDIRSRLAKLRERFDQVGIGLWSGNQLQQSHVTRRIEKMRSEPRLAEIVRKAFRDLSYRQAVGQLQNAAAETAFPNSCFRSTGSGHTFTSNGALNCGGAGFYSQGDAFLFTGNQAKGATTSGFVVDGYNGGSPAHFGVTLNMNGATGSVGQGFALYDSSGGAFKPLGTTGAGNTGSLNRQDSTSLWSLRFALGLSLARGWVASGRRRRWAKPFAP